MCDELPTSVEEHRTCRRAARRTRLHDRREGRIEFVLTGGFREQDLPPEGAACRLCLSRFNVGFQLVRVQQHGDDRGPGNQLVQQPQLLGHQVSDGEDHAGEVAAGPAEAGDKAGADGIVARQEDDRESPGLPP